MLKKVSFLLLAAALLLAACQSAAPAPHQSLLPSNADGNFGAPVSKGAVPPVGAAPAQPAIIAPGQGTSASGAGGAADTVAPASADRLVIKNANLNIVVKDPDAAVNAIAALADQVQGFVVSSSVTQDSVDVQGNKVLSGQISLRVPADKLNSTLATIKALAVTVRSENVTGEDITAKYTDLQSQLKGLQAEADQLQKIMDSGTKTEDVLNVYRELANVQSQIEVLQGQIKYYSESAAMSLIAVTLEQDVSTQPIETGTWQPQGVLKGIAEAWVATYQFVATLALWGVIYCLPIVLVLGLLVGFFWTIVRRLRRGRKATETKA
jgi:hypothetical protein